MNIRGSASVEVVFWAPLFALIIIYMAHFVRISGDASTRKSHVAAQTAAKIDGAVCLENITNDYPDEITFVVDPICEAPQNEH